MLKHAITHDPELTLWLPEFNIFYCLKDKRRTPIQALQPTAVHTRGTPAQPGYAGVHLESTTLEAVMAAEDILTLVLSPQLWGKKMGILIIYTIHRG